MTDLVLGELDVRPGGRVLDIGCDAAGLAVRLAEQADVRVVGVTVSEHQARRAAERAEQTGVADRVEFHHADAMALPFEVESFDHAFALESIMHVPDRAGARSSPRPANAEPARPAWRVSPELAADRCPKT